VWIAHKLFYAVQGGTPLAGSSDVLSKLRFRRGLVNLP
jgi:hypothetical protein